MRVPGGGASCLGVGRPGSGASPPPTARPPGGLPGPTTHWLWLRGAAGVGTRHQPHSARSCELALRLLGRLEGAPERRLLPGCGASGVGRSPTPDCPPSGRAAGAHYPLAVGAGGCGRGDPSPTPQRALLRAGFARYGGGTRSARGGGGAFCSCHWLWVRGGAGVGTRHQPHSARCGVRCRALSHYPLAVGAGGCGRGDPSPTPQRALLRAGFALWGRTCLGVGRVGPPGPNCPPSGRAAGAGCGCGGLLWGRHEGARGGGLLPGCGASGVGRSPPPLPHYRLAVGAGGCGPGDPSPTPQRALLRAGFARCGGGMRVPGGAPFAWVSGALPPPTARPLGGLPGPTTHWPWVRGGAGVGIRHQPHSARSFELALRAVGAA